MPNPIDRIERKWVVWFQDLDHPGWDLWSICSTKAEARQEAAKVARGTSRYYTFVQGPVDFPVLDERKIRA